MNEWTGPLLRGWSQLHAPVVAGADFVAQVAAALVKTIAWQSVWEYYWQGGAGGGRCGARERDRPPPPP